MIELRHIDKRFGATQALRDVSLTARNGDILGLLGVNGAGKSTALNIMTGFFPPTAGTVTVDGMDMLADPLGCKRRIGYLPEQPPLYDELTVREYLTFVCRLREVKAKAIPAHTDDILALCGLTEVAGRPLGKLSKGYRQRAGIAQALCGDPPTLILDEPTVGLDPRQVVEIRDLIRRLGEDHTVIFSSHLLSEVQQLCTRAVILHEGRVAWDAGPNAAPEGEARLRVTLAMPEKRLMPLIRELPGLRRADVRPTRDADCTECTLVFDPPEDPRQPARRLSRLMAAHDAAILMMVPEEDSLESVFLRVTAREEAAR